jgi:EmrB/QacA subfamily drug resistance transporter
MAATTTPSAAAARTGPILFATCGACVMVMAITSAGTTALPAIALDLEPSQTEIQWIGDSYPLVLAALLLPAGSVLDRFGRKRGLIAGLLIMAVALVLGAATTSAGPLILTRCLAGAGAALTFPATLATISHVMPPERRGSAVGLWAATATAGGLIGVLLTGALTEVAWWGSVFLVLAGLTLLCLIPAIITVPETSESGAPTFDLVGALASVVAIGAVVFAVTEAPVHGWDDGAVVGAAVLGVLAGIAFCLWELRTAHPLLDLRLFRNAAVATSSAALFLMFVGMYGWFFLSFQYNTFVLGYSPFDTALALMPFGAAVMFTAPFAPTLARRLGRRPVISGALATAAIGMALMAVLNESADYAALAPAFVIFGVGMGLGATPPTEAILEALPPAEQGVASALNDAARELGAAVGIAVLGSSFNAAYRADVGDALAAVPEPLADAVRSSPAAGFGAIAQAGAQAPVQLLDVIRDGVMAGWRVAFIVGAGVSALTAVYVARRFPGTSAAPAEPPAATAGQSG